MNDKPKETNQRRKGRWICEHSKYGSDIWTCSECGAFVNGIPTTFKGKITVGIGRNNFCCVCGADMRDCLVQVRNN